MRPARLLALPLLTAALVLPALPAHAAGETTVFAITPTAQLVTFDRNSPGTLLSTRALTGLGSGDVVVGLDVRTSNATLVVLARNGSTGTLYTLNPKTAALTRVATLTAAPAATASATPSASASATPSASASASATPTTTASATPSATASATPFSALQGSLFDVDVNPVADRLRVVSDTGQNLRINMDTGATTMDGTLAYASGDRNAGKTPQVTGVAYTSSGGSTAPTSTVTHYLDVAADTESTSSAPNAGTLTSNAQGLGTDVTALVGFDISSDNGGFAAYRTSAGTVFRPLDITTGAFTGTATTTPVAISTFALQLANGPAAPAAADASGAPALAFTGASEVLAVAGLPAVAGAVVVRRRRSA